jgi:NitT/TauT family transport system ATP-binding protein
LKTVAGLARPTSGEALIGGNKVARPQTEIGIVFQKPVLLEWRRVLGNLMIQVEARKLPVAEYRQRALDLLASVGLAGSRMPIPMSSPGG